MPEITLQPIEQAMVLHDAKTPIGSVLRTREWAQVPVQLRVTSQFSAGVESAKVLDRIQGRLSDLLAQRRDRLGRITDRSGFIADLQKLAIAEGLMPTDPKLKGGLQDITSEARAALIYQQQTGQAYGHAEYKAGQDADALQAAPAQRLVRIRQARKPRDWKARWQAAGEKVGWAGASREAFVALKSSPIWATLNRFGTPWPPFDFGSGMWIEDVSRAEARRLGLVKVGEVVPPSDKAVTDELERGVKGMSAENRLNLKSLFGDQVEVDAETIKWKGNAEAYERQHTNIRADAGRVFAQSAEALGGDRLDGGSASPGSGIPEEGARINAVEISAVATGRKPLFHEHWGIEPEHAAAIAAKLQRQLPQGVVARSEASHLFVYDQGLVGRLADPARPIWEQVKAHSDDGRWLGYGVNFHDYVIPLPRALIQDEAGETVAGFVAPQETAELYAAARTLDWTRATGRPHQYVIIRPSRPAAPAGGLV